MCVCKNEISCHQERDKTSFVNFSEKHGFYQKSLIKHICYFEGLFIEQMVFLQSSPFTASVLQHNENKLLQTVNEVGSEEQF